MFSFGKPQIFKILKKPQSIFIYKYLYGIIIVPTGKMNDNNNCDNDKIRIKRYIVLFLMRLRFYFGMIVLKCFTIPSFNSPSFMLLE